MPNENKDLQSSSRQDRTNNYETNKLLVWAKDLVKAKDESVVFLIATDQSSIYRLDQGDNIYVLKTYVKKQVPNKIQQFILVNLFEKNVGGLRFQHRKLDKQKLAAERISLERKVLTRWEEEGITAPKFVATDNINNLLMSYIPGRDYRCLIKDGKYTPEIRDGLFAKIGEIRSKAFKKRDRLLLHNDQWLANFLWVEDKGAVPIDPGLPYKLDMDFETLDAHINLFMCYSLISPHFGYTEETKEAYQDILQRFIHSLDNSTLRRMKGLNKPASAIELAYLKLTSMVGMNKDHYSFLKSFSPRQCQYIGTLIDQELSNQTAPAKIYYPSTAELMEL